MKTLIITNDLQGTAAEVDAKSTYETDFGEWIAEVDGTEIRRVCRQLCGMEDCNYRDLRAEAAQDDDGKEYRIMTV